MTDGSVSAAATADGGELRRPPADWRLAPAAVLAWAIAATALSLPGSQGWSGAACLAVLLGIGALGAAGRLGPLRPAAGLVAVTAAAGLLAATAAGAWLAHRVPPELAAAIDAGPVEAELVVTALVDDAALGAPPGAANAAASGPPSFGSRFRANLVALRTGQGAVTLEVPVLVSGTIDAERPPDPGARLEASVRLREAPAAERVGAFVAFVEPAIVVGEPTPVLAGAAELRASFRELAAGLPGGGGQLLPGLAVGDDRGVGDELEQAMKDSSLTHLTAVSGANCALVVGIILLAGRAVGASRGVRLAAAGLALAAFTALVTPQGSVIRAAAMAGFVLAVEGTGRRVGGAPVLCLAVTILLVVDPGLALDVGFALSAAATLGLLHGAGPLAERMSGWMPRPLALAIAVPTAAQLACQPVLILLEPSLPAYGVLANLLADPAAPIATITGLAACLLATLAPPLAVAAAWIAWIPASWIAAVAEATASWPGALIPWPPGLGGCLALALPTLALAWLATPGGNARRERWRRRVLAASLLLGAAIVAGALAGQASVRAATMPDPWRYAACDVGQGDATLVRTDVGVALIDTGPQLGPLAACLRELDVDRIAALILTHFDHDHDGAALELLERADALVLPDTEEARGQPVGQVAEAAGIPVSFVAAGDRMALGDLEWEVLWPARASDGGPSFEGGNEASLAVRIVPGPGCAAACLSLTALADLDAAAQSRVLGTDAEVAADVVKMSHHGSRDQEPAMYAAIGARIALVSVGEDNGYGHPTRDALDLLAAAGADAARTDELGTLVLGGEPGEPRGWSSR